jgi:hypothetical protein
MIRTSTRSTLDQESTRRGFPQRKAFVLQFSDDAGPRTGLFRGRVEHVTSGDQATFHSTEQFWTFVRTVLTRSGVEQLPALPSARAGSKRSSR